MKTLCCNYCRRTNKRFGSWAALMAHMRAKHPAIEIKPPARNDPFYQSHEWVAARYAALKRSMGVCECCGNGPQQGAILNVDHIKPRRQHPELSLDPNNLQVLCKRCNEGKGNADATDWREHRGAIDETLDREHLDSLRDRGLLH